MDDTPRPITSHLQELRKRLFWVIGVWGACAAISGLFVSQLFELLMGPAVNALRAREYELIAINPPEIFFAYVKTALLVGFLVSIPVTLYQVWGFVGPALYQSERRFAIPFVLATTLLFFAGALFGYFVAFPFVFEYFLSLESDIVRTSWSVQAIFAFMSRLYLAFGIAFQLPVAIFFFSLAGIVTPERLAKSRPSAVVIMFVVGAVLTPPDIVSQVSLAVPLLVLYESGIWISRIVIRRRNEPDKSESTDLEP